MKKIISMICFLVLALVGCVGNNSESTTDNSNSSTILLAAAASMQNCLNDKIIPMFEEKYPNVLFEACASGGGSISNKSIK